MAYPSSLGASPWQSLLSGEPQPQQQQDANPIQELIRQAFAPKPAAQMPVREDPGVGQRVLAGLADALSVYASARNPNVQPTHSTADLRQTLLSNQRARSANVDSEAQANQESTQKMAEYQLANLEKEAAHKQRVADAISEDERHSRLRRELQQDAKDARAKAESTRQDFEKTMQGEQRAFTAGQNKLDREATQTKTETANKPKTNKQAHASDEDVNAARLTAAQLADSIEAGQEKRSPEMIRKSFMRKVSAVVPSERMPDVEAYYAEHVDSLFKKPDAAAAAGPTGPSRFDLIQKALSLGAGQFARTWDDKDLEAFIAKASGTPSARPR